MLKLSIWLQGFSVFDTETEDEFSLPSEYMQGQTDRNKWLKFLKKKMMYKTWGHVKNSKTLRYQKSFWSLKK